MIIEPLRLNEDFVREVFTKDQTHRCSKAISDYCPFEDTTKTEREFCTSIKTKMEKYHCFQISDLTDSDIFTKEQSNEFNKRSVSIRRYNCCGSYEIFDGNHRLCIAKKTGTPVYATFEETDICYKCKNINILERSVKNLFRKRRVYPFYK